MARIVCATDFSRAATRAARIAAALAERFGDTLELVHVVDLRAAYAAGRSLGAARAAAQRELLRVKQTLGARVSIETTLRVGFVADTLLAAVNASPPRLMVLGTYGRGAIVRFLLGSVARRALRTAPCPVLVVPDRPEVEEAWTRADRPLRVLAALDATANDQAALSWVRELRLHLSCDVTFVQVYSPARQSRRLCLDWPDGTGRDRMTLVLERELRDRVGELPGDGRVAVGVLPTYSDDLDPLERAVADQDLLVMSAGPGDRREAGGALVAERRTTNLPVLCVPAVGARVQARRAGASRARADSAT